MCGERSGGLEMIYGFICEVISKLPLEKEEFFVVNNTKIELIPKSRYLSEIKISRSISLKDGNFPFQGVDNKGIPVFVFNRDSDCYNELKDVLQQIESFLGYYYELKKIKWEHPKEFWKAENENEKRKLTVFSSHLEPVYPDIQDPLNVENLKDLLEENKTLKNYKIPLSFFREGKNYFKDFRYIDAFNYFYLGIESIYGNGKTRVKQLIEEYKKSDTLKSYLDGNKSKLMMNNENKENLTKIATLIGFQNWEKNIVEFIVRIRGFLHHHTLKSDLYGNPFDHEKYKTPALLLMSILSACLYYELSVSSKLILT